MAYPETEANSAVSGAVQEKVAGRKMGPEDAQVAEDALDAVVGASPADVVGLDAYDFVLGMEANPAVVPAAACQDAGAPVVEEDEDLYEGLEDEA